MAVLVVLLLAVILSVCGASTVPGVKIRFSRRGLDFVSNAAQDVLLTELTNGSIVDQHFKSGKSKYDITGVQITSFKKPSAVTTVAPGRGITWTLSGGAISMKGNWYYKYHQNWLFQISYAGTFDISATGFEISLSIILGMDNAGQPTVQTTGCSSDVRTLTVHLHGDHAKFFEVFDQQVAQRMKTQLKTKLCEAAQKAIRKNGAKRMKRLNLQVNFAKWLVMDDRLVQAPKFTSSYFESFHKGEVFGHNYIEAPFQPQPLRDEPIGGARMMTIWISEYVLNTLGYVVQTHDLIQFKLSNKELAKKGKPNLLDTTCTGNVCIGSFLPGISKRFPNSSVSVHLASTGETDRPRFTMLPGKLQLLLVGMAYFSVKTPNGTEVHLEKARIHIFATMDVHLQEKRLTTKMSNLRIKMDFVHAKLGVDTKQKLEAFFTKVADICIKPKLDEIGDVGLVIPQYKDVEFVNPIVKIVKGALQLGVDFKFNDAGAFRER